MKNETIASDITRTLAARKATIRRKNTLARVLIEIDAGRDHAPATNAAIAARLASLAADSDLARTPAPRRTLAAHIIEMAEALGKTAAQVGEEYSGETEYLVNWGTLATASTATGQGAQYSRACTYRKTDADHIVTLDPLGVALLVESETLRIASKRDGLHLIALYPDDSAVWVKPKGKAITSERGWIVAEGPVCYHSLKSRDHARAGLVKKLAAEAKEQAARRQSAKINRRARLVARLCNGITATIADAKSSGYCDPGIRAFQSRFAIGDAATLPELVRTGDPSAVALALRIARTAAV